MVKGAFRQRYSLAVSCAYILIGLVIVGRCVVAHVYVPGLLGVVLIALGAVRIRDYLTWRRTSVDS